MWESSLDALENTRPPRIRARGPWAVSCRTSKTRVSVRIRLWLWLRQGRVAECHCEADSRQGASPNWAGILIRSRDRGYRHVTRDPVT